MHPVNHVAVTAAYEHFTAVMATGVLTHPNWLDGATPELALLWRWHAVEESEHKTVAFDLYRAMGGSERRRRLWFVYIAVQFFFESSLQTFINLWRAGQWWQPRTWWQAARYLFLLWGGMMVGRFVGSYLMQARPAEAVRGRAGEQQQAEHARLQHVQSGCHRQRTELCCICAKLVDCHR